MYSSAEDKKRDFSALCKGECLCHFAHGFVLSVASDATSPGVHLCKKNKKKEKEKGEKKKKIIIQSHCWKNKSSHSCISELCRWVGTGGFVVFLKRQCQCQILQLHEISLLIFIHW